MYTVGIPCAARKVVRLRLRGCELSPALVRNLRTQIPGGGVGGYFCAHVPYLGEQVCAVTISNGHQAPMV